jgi:hypothetical protein
MAGNSNIRGHVHDDVKRFHDNLLIASKVRKERCTN